MASFVPNRNLESELARGDAYQQALVAKAEEAAGQAKAIAPVGTEVHETPSGYVNHPGDYKKSIKVVVDPSHVPGGKGGRSGVLLTATDWKAHWIEWGSVNNQAFAPLRRGVRAVGLDLRESSK